MEKKQWLLLNLQLGCDGYANKPLDTDKMEEVLKKLELIK